MIGKGSGTAQRELFSVTPADQWDRNRESFELFRRLWREDRVTWTGQFRPPLVEIHGHDPADALVGAGTAAFYAAPTSQEAIDTYRPIFDAQQATMKTVGVQPAFSSVEDAVERGSHLIGSPQQIIRPPQPPLPVVAVLTLHRKVVAIRRAASRRRSGGVAL